MGSWALGWGGQRVGGPPAPSHPRVWAGGGGQCFPRWAGLGLHLALRPALRKSRRPRPIRTCHLNQTPQGQQPRPGRGRPRGGKLAASCGCLSPFWDPGLLPAGGVSVPMSKGSPELVWESAGRPGSPHLQLPKRRLGLSLLQSEAYPRGCSRTRLTGRDKATSHPG